MDIEIGREVVNVGKNYVNKGIEKVNFSKIRPYFNVTNKYVLKKILLILFPFKNKEWHGTHFTEIISTEPPRISSPDLYIPIMAFLTYILLFGIKLGLNNKFKPEKLGLTFTRAVLLEIICLVIVKLTSYFLDITELGILDFISFSGYKFVIIIFIMGCKIPYFGRIVRIYLYCSFFFFLSRSLKGFILIGTSHLRRRKIYFLFFTVLLEIILIFLFSY